VNEFGITSTRTALSPWYGTPQQLDYSDYVFTSPGITPHQFAAPDVRVSDHRPLILDFDVA
jgi:hypothetical protein